MRASCAPVMIVAERFRADESGFAETGDSHAKRLLVAMFGLFKEMERTGIEPVTSGLQSRSGEASSHSRCVTISRGFQGTASRRLLDAARPCFNVFYKPNRAGAEACNWRWEV